MAPFIAEHSGIPTGSFDNISAAVAADQDDARRDAAETFSEHDSDRDFMEVDCDIDDAM